jgi:hypothetical protein
VRARGRESIDFSAMSFSHPAGNAAVLQGGLEPLPFGVSRKMMRPLNDFEEDLIPSLLPQAESELTCKDFAKQKYAQKKRTPARFNTKEERARKKKMIERLVKRVEELSAVEIKPHAFSDTLDPLHAFIGDLGKYLCSFEGKEADDIIRHSENICILAYNLCGASSFSDVFVAFVSYMKFYVKTSITNLVTTMTTVLLEKEEEVGNSVEVSNFLDSTGAFDLDFDLEPQAWTGRDLLDGWELLKTNTIFKKVSYLITAAMASSICSIKGFEFDIGGITLIAIEAMKEQIKATDLIDALIQTFVWISETGWWCLKEKSLAPVLYQDQRLREYTDTCNTVIAYASTAMAGNLDGVTVEGDLEEYERKLDKCMKTTGEIQRVTSSPGVKELLQRKYAALVSIKMDLVAKRKNTSFRFAPIGFSIHGESSIGKSDIAPLTMKTSLSAMGFKTSQDGLITLNETDKFESTYTSDVMGVYIDDANNANSKFVEKSPTQKYIQFFNNVAAQAVKAELNEKGCVFINFKCGVITTNTKTLGAQQYSNYPVAVLRRFFHVQATVKEQYCRENGTSLNTDHPDLVNAPSGTFVDVWNFTIEEVIPNGTKMGRFETVQVELVKGKGLVACANMNLQQYLLAIAALSRNHKDKQVKQVARSKLLEGFEVCPNCSLITQYCACSGDISMPVCAPCDAKGPLTDTKVAGLEPEGKNLEPDKCTQDTKPPAQQGFPRRRNPKNIPHALADECVSFVVRTAVKDIAKRMFRFFNPFLAGLLFSSASHYLPVREIRQQVDLHMQRNIPRIVALTPNWLYTSSYGKRLVGQYFNHYECVNMLACQKWIQRYFLVFLTLSTIACGWSGLVLSSVISWVGLIFCESHIKEERERFISELTLRRDIVLADQGREYRGKWLVTGTVAAISLVGIVTILKAWNLARQTPHSIQDPAHNDSAPGWYGFMLGKTGGKVQCEKTGATSDQLCNSIEKNICWGRFTLEDGTVNKCGVWFPRKSMMNFPRHVFYPGSDMNGKQSKLISVEVIRHNSTGGRFSFKVHYDYCFQYPGLDLCAAYVPNSPDFRSMERWLPLAHPTGSCLAMMICPTLDGSKIRGAVSPKFGTVAHSFMEMQGAQYTTLMARNGACMSPIIREGVNPCIVGFHIGGNETHHIGISQTLLRKDHDLAEAWLESRNGFLSAAATDIPVQQMGVDVRTTDQVNPKAKFVASMTDDNFVDLLGSTKIRSEQKSRVVPSILSSDVEEIMGVPNTWGPPRLKPNWDAFNKNVELFSKPGDMFDPELLDRAQKDWEKPLLVAMDTHAKNEEGGFCPLTLKESILGIPGRKYVDAMPMNTGVGFPLFGKKNKVDAEGNSVHFDETFQGEVLLDRVPKEHIQGEIDRLLDCYRRGVRGYPVTSATLKDEPTPLDKEKVRVFQAAPVAMSILIRMYFLPIARFLHLHPTLAETAVGVNAFSKDWEELMDFAEQFGKEDDQMLAWDYSKYDVRMNSQVTRKVWDSFIHLAARGGYDQESLTIMQNMIADIVHPIMDLNGTLLMSYNMNTSGNNMTVDVNGGAGSLYVRMGFFSLYPEVEDFRSKVAHLTYGDDAKGSNAADTRKFNFIYYKKFLAKHGMKLTLPTKTDDEVEFLRTEETDFLKRISHHIPEIGCAIGQLDEESIFKSLHSNLKSSSATPREVAASVIETALHEWFAFGREHYEMRRAQLRTICERQQLPVEALKYTFDDRVAFWKDKYQNA